MSLLEEFIAELNVNVFLREFAVSNSLVPNPGAGEIEIADHLVFLDDQAIVYQLKERSSDAAADLKAVSAWFQGKVKRRAVTQIRNTLQYLSDNSGTLLSNDRGHELAIPGLDRDSVSALVIYRSPTPDGFVPTRGYDSKRAGFVHFMNAVDYFNICDLLVTPTEIIEYLRFRRVVIEEYPDEVLRVGEAGLAGQFLIDEPGPPNDSFAGALSALRERREEWDLGFLTDRLGEQIVYRKGDDSETSHYKILLQLAKLSRSELKSMKERLLLALDAVHEDRFVAPFRFAVPRTDCG